MLFINFRDNMERIDCAIHFGDVNTNRKKLFEEALLGVERGRVLYILNEELNELPQLSQESNSLNRHYMKMITFLYTNSLESIIESISTLPDWQNVPATIILDDCLGMHCNKSNLQTACGIVAFLLDTAHCCSSSLNTSCKIHISLSSEIVAEDCYNVLKDLYCR